MGVTSKVGGGGSVAGDVADGGTGVHEDTDIGVLEAVRVAVTVPVPVPGNNGVRVADEVVVGTGVAVVATSVGVGVNVGLHEGKLPVTLTEVTVTLPE